MSDAHTDDPVLAHLRERKATLEGVAADTMARLAEIDALLATFADGRTRVRRRLEEFRRRTAPAHPIPGRDRDGGVHLHRRHALLAR